MSRRRRVFLGAAGASLAALLVAACGSSTNSARTSVTTTSSAGHSTSTTPSSPGHSTTTTASRVLLDYPAGGPSEPIVPPNDDAYVWLVSAECDRLLGAAQAWDKQVAANEGASTKPLYLSAAYACLGRWDDAIRTYAQIDATHREFSERGACAKRVVLQWLTALINARERNPNFDPVFVKSSGSSPCGREASTTTTFESTTTSTTFDVGATTPSSSETPTS